MKEDEHILVDQKIEGLSGTLGDEANGLLLQNPNARLFVIPFTHLAHIHELGKSGISLNADSTLIKLRRDDLIEDYQIKMRAAASNEEKIDLQEKLDRKVARKNEKLAKRRSGEKPHKKLISGFDIEKEKEELKEIEAKYDAKIAKVKRQKKVRKLKNKKANKVDNQKKTINQGNQLMRWGEELAVYDFRKADQSKKQIGEFLNANGYFRNTIFLDTTSVDSLSEIRRAPHKFRDWFSGISGVKHRFVSPIYIVDKRERYEIDSIIYDVSDPALLELIEARRSGAPLKKTFYSQDILTNERDFIYDIAVNNGYYEFNKQYVGFEIDSTLLGNNKLVIKEIIKNPKNQDRHSIFYLDSIVYISNASATSSNKERKTDRYKGITFNFGSDAYSKKILRWRIPIEEGDRYSRDLTIETQRQIYLLDNSKFVNINYDTTDRRFIANIFTSPFDRFQTSTEVGLSSTQGYPGPFFNVNVKNRNTFGGLEIVSFDANAKLEDLEGVAQESNERYTSRQFGGEITIDFPQILFPLGDSFKKKIGRFNPRTTFDVTFGFEDRIAEYVKTTYSTEFAYSWRLKNNLQYKFTPFLLQRTRSDNTDSFQEELERLRAEGSTYPFLFESAVFTSTRIERTRSTNRYLDGEEGDFILVSGEFGGNPNSIFGSNFFGENLETYRFIRGNLDYRETLKLRRKLNLAYRINIGIGYPFGDNLSLPYERYFFLGGSNSVRAWRPNRLGPGAYGIAEVEEIEQEDGSTITRETGRINERLENPGELMFQSSLELRQDLVGFMEAAFFIDLGNLWLLRGNLVNPAEDADAKLDENGELQGGDDGKFRVNTFMKEIAVGTGIGFRFDLQFLIFRLDLGLRMLDPAQPLGERFVGDRIFSDFNYVSELNIGIGYPF